MKNINPQKYVFTAYAYSLTLLNTMKHLTSNSGSTSMLKFVIPRHRPMHNYQKLYLDHKLVWRHSPMCFAGPVRVLWLQSTEQVQGLWLLLLQLRHWFQEGSRAEELLQLSVGIKEGEGKILAWLGACNTKTNFRVRDNVRPTAAAVRGTPNVTSSVQISLPMWSVRASLRDPDTQLVLLSPAWAFSVFLFLYFSPLCTVKESFTGLCIFCNLYSVI